MSTGSVRTRLAVSRSKLGSTWPMALKSSTGPIGGFIEEVVVLTPSKVGQFSQGWKGTKSVTRSSYSVVAKLIVDNSNAMDLIEVVVHACVVH